MIKARNFRCCTFISLSKFNLPLIGTFTWPTPPGPYRATTCRGRVLISGSHTYFFDHTRTWRASPDGISSMPGPPLRQHKHERQYTPSTHSVKPTTVLYSVIIAKKANMEWWLRRPNDIRGPWEPKVSWHLSYRWGKTPKKPHPENLSRPGTEPGPAACQARMLPLAPQRWTCCTLTFFFTFKISKLACHAKNIRNKHPSLCFICTFCTFVIDSTFFSPFLTARAFLHFFSPLFGTFLHFTYRIYITGYKIIMHHLCLLTWNVPFLYTTIYLR